MVVELIDVQLCLETLPMLGIPMRGSIFQHCEVRRYLRRECHSGAPLKLVEELHEIVAEPFEIFWLKLVVARDLRLKYQVRFEDLLKGIGRLGKAGEDQSVPQ